MRAIIRRYLGPESTSAGGVSAGSFLEAGKSCAAGNLTGAFFNPRISQNLTVIGSHPLGVNGFDTLTIKVYG